MKINTISDNHIVVIGFNRHHLVCEDVCDSIISKRLNGFDILDRVETSNTILSEFITGDIVS